MKGTVFDNAANPVRIRKCKIIVHHTFSNLAFFVSL